MIKERIMTRLGRPINLIHRQVQLNLTFNAVEPPQGQLDLFSGIPET
jgi:hypothetical protein